MAPKKGMSNRRGLERREEILEAATELFATRGYRGGGMLELGKRVGMSHVGILHHFGTKENLLRAVMERRDEKQNELMVGLREEGLDAFLMKYVIGTNAFVEPEVMTRLGTVLRAENLTPDDPLHEYFDNRAKEVREFLSAEIRTRQESGEYRTDIDPDTKAAEILAFTIGLETQWLLNREVVDLEKIFASFVRSLLDDLTSQSTPRCRPKRTARQKVR